MASSKSINYSKYSIIREQNLNLSNNLDLIEKNNEKEVKSLNELSQILVSNNQDTIKNNNSIEKKGLTKVNNEQTTQISIHNLLYGNPIDSEKPKYLGKSFAFLYDFEGNPKITIGPDCKQYLF